MTDYDVIICGLGPVGQLLALLLGDHGVRTLALRPRARALPLPRAAVIDDEVLRIFQSVGLDEAVLADAQVQPGASIVTAAGRAGRDHPLARGPPRPPAAGLDQPAGDGAHDARRARRSGRRVDVRRGLTLESLDRRADRVDAFVRPTDGGPLGADLRALARRLRRRRAARCGRGCRSRSRAAPHPQRWIVVDALVDRPLRKVPHPHFVGDAPRARW